VYFNIFHFSHIFYSSRATFLT